MEFKWGQKRKKLQKQVTNLKVKYFKSFTIFQLIVTLKIDELKNSCDLCDFISSHALKFQDIHDFSIYVKIYVIISWLI